MTNANHERASLYRTLALSPEAALAHISRDIGATGAKLSARRVRVMAQVRDGVSGAPFHLGELLATEAVAEIDGHEGYMLRVGGSLAAAQHAAAILARLAAAPECGRRLGELLAQQDETRGRANAAETAAVRATQVRFEGGEVEGYAASDFTTDR